MATYQASPIRPRQRRSNAELTQLDDAIYGIVLQIKPATVRQTFYQCVVRGLVPKEEAGYDVVQRRLLRLRESTRIPYWWITDNVRTVRGYNRWSDLTGFGKEVAGLYRRDYWAGAPTRVEIWLEKDALAGVLFPVVVDEWGLDLFVTRGFSSVSYLQAAAETIKADGRTTHIHCLTDHDPSGIAIARKLIEQLPQRARGVRVTVERLAVTPAQISQWNLPTRPTKQSDSRSKKFEEEFGEGSVELDAIPPDELRRLVSEAIAQHADPRTIAIMKDAEESERLMLQKIDLRSL